MLKKIKSFLASFLILLFICSNVVLANSLSSNRKDRISGNDRYLTAISISQKGWTTSDYAIIARGDDFPDSLCAGPLAYAYNAPILLSDTHKLNSEVRQELLRLKVKHVFIAGGYGAISQEVENEIHGLNIGIERLAGNTRFETSIEIAERLESRVKELTGKDINGVVLATGMDYPDSLSISPIASKLYMPILLTCKNDTIQGNIDYINKYKNSISKTYIIGLQGVISDGVASKYINPERIGGKDRYETNEKILIQLGKQADLKYNNILVAVGDGKTNQDGFPDGLACAPYAAKNNSPLVLVYNKINDYTKDFIQKCAEPGAKITFIGGSGVLPETVFDEIGSQINGITDTDDINVSVNQGEKYTLPSTVSVKMTNGANKEMPITWNTNAVDTSKSGVYTFTGTVSGYSKNITLKLTVNAIVSSIDDINVSINQGDQYTLPKTVTAKMSDNTTKEVSVSWNPTTVDTSKAGTYTLTGTVSGYSKNVTLKLSVNVIISSIDDINVSINQGEQYILPKTVTAKMSDNTTKEVSVAWNPVTVDTSKTGTYTFTGTVSGYSKNITLKLTVNAIVSSIDDINTSINQGDQYTLPKTVTAKMSDNTTKEVSVAWNPATVDTSKTGTFIFTGTVSGYPKNVTFTLTIKPVVISGIDDINATIYQNDQYTLPKIVTAKMSNNTVKELPVVWNVSTVDTSKIGICTLKGKVDGYDKDVLLNLNITKYDPSSSLYINTYPAATFNDVCTSIGMNIVNSGTKKVSIKKIEVYEKGKLYTTYTSSDLANSNLPTEIAPNESWSGNINFKYGYGIWLDNSYVKYYIECNGNDFEYQSNIKSII